MRRLAPDQGACRGSTVIVVDDEPSFRQLLAEALRDDGHEVLEFPSATAVPPVDTLPSDAILLTDFEMPGRNGIELADSFRRACSSGRAILLSAYAVPAVDGAVATRPWLRFVSKPVDYERLHQLIHEL
jgi:two-component system C4-dicarboxylate transport response regulator DctD